MNPIALQVCCAGSLFGADPKAYASDCRSELRGKLGGGDAGAVAGAAMSVFSAGEITGRVSLSGGALRSVEAWPALVEKRPDASASTGADAPRLSRGGLALVAALSSGGRDPVSPGSGLVASVFDVARWTHSL